MLLWRGGGDMVLYCAKIFSNIHDASAVSTNILLLLEAPQTVKYIIKVASFPCEISHVDQSVKSVGLNSFLISVPTWESTAQQIAKA